MEEIQMEINIIKTIICIIVYFVGMYVTQIISTVVDRRFPKLRVGTVDVLIMVNWPCLLPILIASLIVYAVSRLGKDAGNKIFEFINK